MRWWPPWPERDRGTLVRLRADLQRTRLDLGERDDALERARADLERERAQGEERAREAARDEIAGLVEVIGTPLTQLTTLAHLRDQGTVTPRADDVLEIAGRLVRAMADRDIRPSGTLGDSEPFDPDRHDPVGSDPVAPGDPVMIRFVGFAHGSRLLRKAGVEPRRGSEPG